MAPRRYYAQQPRLLRPGWLRDSAGRCWSLNRWDHNIAWDCDNRRTVTVTEARTPKMLALATNSARCYYVIVIRSYQDKDTQTVAERRRVRSLPGDIQRRAQRKLMILNNATNINDLRVPPGNRLKALSGDRDGQHSIRINDQWRICFVWSDGNAHQVEIVDYH